MRLPIGISDFKKLVTEKSPYTNEGYIFVDKSPFIREITDDPTEVIVITRPRRFGKTLNLSMLQYFFAAEVDGVPTAGLFDGLAIAQDPECIQLQGKFPVIFISFKDVKADNFDSAINGVYEQIYQVYNQHRYLLKDLQLAPDEKEIFLQILNKKANIDTLVFSLKNLSHYLYKHTNQKAYILIDEYDTPIQAAHIYNYYDKFMPFIRNLLSSALKGNNYLKQAVITGILRVAKESLFSGLNNVTVHSIFSDRYANFFGFTEAETNELLTKAKLPTVVLQQTEDWYNGYNFGGVTIYNPYSIVELIYRKGKLMAYWINTSGDELIKDLIINANPAIKEKLQTLIAGGTIQEYIDEHMVFGDLSKDTNNNTAIWSLLITSGYLKYVTYIEQDGIYLCELQLPNKEVADYYTLVIKTWIAGARGYSWYREFLNSLASGNVSDFAEKLETLIEETLSYHDVTKASQESFYHGLMLAFVSGLKDTHEIKSNKESGKGRYDVMLVPKALPSTANPLGIVMEFKAMDDPKNLAQAALNALEQIKKSNYIVELKTRGLTKICSMGIAFSGKAIKVVSE